MSFDRCRSLLSSFLQFRHTGIENFLDAVQFREPKVPHVVEALVDGVEALIDALAHTVEAHVDVQHQEAEQQRVEEHGYPDGEVQLGVGHRFRISLQVMWPTLLPLASHSSSMSLIRTWRSLCEAAGSRSAASLRRMRAVS